MSTSGEQKPEAPETAQGKSPSGPRRRGRGRRGRGRRTQPPRTAPPQAAGSALPAPPPELAAQPADQTALEPKTTQSAISQAIDEAGQIVESLKAALDQMEEVLELIELAERQKIDDEREIESLRRALRQLHHPREGGQEGQPARRS